MRHISTTDPLSELRSELSTARHLILDLVGTPYRELLESYGMLNDKGERWQWETNVINKIVDLAEPKSVVPQPYSYETHVRCPLCGASSQSIHADGFSWPEGLYRHLNGWGGHVQQCRVMYTASQLAHERWERQFGEDDRREDAEKRAKLEERRRTEILYRLHPQDQPRLKDEHVWSSDDARTADELAWAEDRLRTLGFELRDEANVRAYVRDHGDFCIWANPLRKRTIAFHAFPSEIPKKRRLLSQGDFSIQDGWYRDEKTLRGKYAAFAEAAGRATLERNASSKPKRT